MFQVTEENKKEYVKLYVTYRWCQGIEQQFLALQKGFHEVIPQHHLRPFDERELELVIGKFNAKLFLETFQINLYFNQDLNFPRNVPSCTR